MQFIPRNINGETIFSLVDDEDYERFIKFSWWCSSEGYTVGRYNRLWNESALYLHRLILHPPEGLFVDHINGVRLDNRRCNLRICTRQQNNTNKRKRSNLSGYTGVGKKESGRWSARIRVCNQGIYLGTYETKEEAAREYDRAALLYFGEFAKTNFNELPVSLDTH